MSAKPSLSDVLTTISRAADTVDALDSASNLVRSETSLRRRAKNHEVKARKARIITLLTGPTELCGLSWR